MMKKRVLGALVCLGLGLACGREPDPLPPVGQIRLFIMTDAILPLDESIEAEPNKPAPLFDRVRVDLFKPGEDEPCGGCAREFPIYTRPMNEGRASIGLRPLPRRAGYRARVRIYRSKAVVGTEPPPHVTIERTFALPTVEAEGIVEATATLFTDDLGKASTEPLFAVLGPPAKAIAGTWAGAQRVDCATPPGPNEVCVPGGAFWMGDAHTLSGTQYQDDPQREKLVIVSPFFMGATEITTREFRASNLAEPETLLLKNFPISPTLAPGNPVLWKSYFGTGAPYFWCNYTEVFDGTERDGIRLEDLPVNCIDPPLARKYCTQSGGDLPTEAQYEYVASGLASRPFLWGNDDPSCTDSVWGRAGTGVLRVLWANCLAPGATGGALPPGSGARDHLDLPTGTIFDLQGNMTEWMRDTWQRSTEECWNFSLGKDPVCEKKSTIDPQPYVLRGGSWAFPGVTLRATFRQGIEGVEPFGAFGGFRCVRPGR